MEGDKKKDEAPIIRVMSPRDDDRYDRMMEDRMADYEPEYEEEDVDSET